ncbi:MAG: nicotinate (nicotinamide) nucleotide adenylyltransferase [Pirellulales bacterium]|nr:nicotinate (nicotinamide) nucleotide adenylyltransferase [Pirellulales bacterium]
MRLGLLGGSFDPVHYGHLLLAECCREQCRLDRVLFLPAANPPHKQGEKLSSAGDRAAMLRLALAGHEPFAVDTFEIDRGGTSWTVDTLRHFCRTHGDDELFLLLGADMLADLPNWREAGEICRLALPVAVARPGAGEIDLSCLRPVASPERIDQIRRHQVAMPAIGTSGTDLRRRAAAGQSLRFQTPRAVEEYIRTHELYGSQT